MIKTLMSTSLVTIILLIPLNNGIIFVFLSNDSNDNSFLKSLQEKTNQAFNENLDERINQFMVEGHIPTLAACVIHKNRIIYSRGYGEQSNGNIAFIIASITKTFVATALLQLYEQGLFDLDEDINNFLPFSLRNPNYPDHPITFRLLLLHQSSLQRGGDLYRSFVFNDLEQKLGQTNETLPSFPAWLDDVLLSPEAQNTSEVWGRYPPGRKLSNVAYSNLGYDLLGYLVELISNQTIEEYFKSNIFTPLNMTNTHYSYQSYSSDELASPTEWIPDDRNDENFTTDNNNNFHLPQFDLDELGAGALRSTTTDLSHFLIAHMNKGMYKNNRILSAESINLMHNASQVFYGDKQYDSYGFGWMNNRINGVELDGEYFLQPLQGHGGRTYGFNSLMFFNQDIEVGVILFANQGSLWMPEAFNLWDIFDVLYKEGFRFSRDSRSGIIPGFSFFISSLTCISLVSVTKFQTYKRNKREH
jgi:CubicO group peptidase (beta-lactamase class C family)